MDSRKRLAPRLPQLQRAPVWHLIAITIAIVAFFVGSTFYSQHVAARLDEDATSIAENASPSIESLSAARGAALRAEVAVARAVEAAPGGGDGEHAAAQEALAAIRRHESDYLSQPFYPGERDYWKGLDDATRAFEQEIALCFEALAKGHVDEARTRLVTKLRPATERLDERLQFLVSFNATQQHRLGLDIPRVRRSAARTAYLLDGVSAVLAILLIALVFNEARKRQQLLGVFNQRLADIVNAAATITSSLGRGEDQPPVLAAIVNEACQLVDADYAALGFGSDPERPFESFVYQGFSPAQAAALGRFPRPVGVLGEVVTRNRPLRIRDLSKHASFRGLPSGHPAMGPFLGVPLRRDGRGAGNLYLARRPGRPSFTAEDEHVLQLLAAQAVISTDNARLYQELERQRRRAELLAAAGSKMFTSLDYESTLDQIAHAVLPEFADLCIIHITDEDGTVVRMVMAAADPAWRVLLNELTPKYGRPQSKHPVFKALHERRPQRFVYDENLLRQIAQNEEHFKTLQQIPMKHALFVPIVGRSRLLGVISFHTFADKPFDDRGVEFGEEVARRAALSIDNAILYERTSRAVQAREDLLAIVSHDLRNPLNAIQMTTELMRREAARDDQKRVDLSDRIARTATGMTLLIEDLLSASKIESGTFRVDLKEQGVDSLIGDAIDQFRDAAAAKSIILQSTIEEGVGSVMCDRDRCLQVFSNLIGNALKFTPAGGTITVTARVSGGEICVAVCDTGAGIPESEREHVFDRYWQASHSRRAGAGLGLFIVKGIVDAHGGHAWAEAGPGGGACLCFTLPAASRAAAPPPELTTH